MASATAEAYKIILSLSNIVDLFFKWKVIRDIVHGEEKVG
jgi:hypothetical protein